MERSSLVQHRRHERYIVELADTEFTYRTKTRTGESSSAVPYELLGRHTTESHRANPFFRNAAVYFAILVVATVAFGLLADMDSRVALLWLFIALGCYAAYRFSGVRYEVYPLTDGRGFRLLHNKPDVGTYRSFRAELYARRDAYLRDRYARVNIERPARLERRRIEWLRDEGVINEQAFITIVETIEDHAAER